MLYYIESGGYEVLSTWLGSLWSGVTGGRNYMIPQISVMYFIIEENDNLIPI